jgi:hypothetical protein
VSAIKSGNPFAAAPEVQCVPHRTFRDCCIRRRSLKYLGRNKILPADAKNSWIKNSSVYNKLV